MHRFRSASVLAWLSIVALLVVGAILLQQFRLFERFWFQWRQDHHAEQWRGHALWLPDYRVVLEARPIEGLTSDLSALTYDPERHTLFSVTNKDPQIIELSLDGRLLRRIALRGFSDPEAIEYIGPGLYVISDERRQRLIKVRLEADTLEVDAAQAQQLSLGIGRPGNKGFEGLAYDPVGQRLFVAKERDPLRIYEIQGFPHVARDEHFAVHVRDDPQRDAGLFIRDISSLDFDTRSGHLLVLSDESRLILELDAERRPISSLSLTRGAHGLRQAVPQAEGLATDGQGTLYLISEPNLFYVFKKAGAGQ